MKEKEYTLDFYQALKEVIENKAWVKGNNFSDGIYLKLDNNGKLVQVDVARCSMTIEVPFIAGLHYQKFRIITVATVKELCG